MGICVWIVLSPACWAQLDFCTFSNDDFAPLASPRPQPETITPATVFILTQELGTKLGFKSQHDIKLPMQLQEVSPKHNLTLAFDLFVMQQLWHQQRGHLRHPVSYDQPVTVTPRHIYQWVDASLALGACTGRWSLGAAMEDTSELAMLTPADEFQALSELVYRQLQHIPMEHIRNFVAVRSTQMIYLLQQLLVEHGDVTVAKWSAPRQLSSRTLLENMQLVYDRLLPLNGHHAALQLIPAVEEAPFTAFKQVILNSLIFSELVQYAKGRRNPPLPPLITIAGGSISLDDLNQRYAHLAQLLGAMQRLTAAQGEAEQ